MPWRVCSLSLEPGISGSLFFCVLTFGVGKTSWGLHIFVPLWVHLYHVIGVCVITCLCVISLCVCVCREERRQGKNCCGQMKYLTAYLLVFPLLYESDLMLSYSCSEIVQLSLKCLKTYSVYIFLQHDVIKYFVVQSHFRHYKQRTIHSFSWQNDSPCLQVW